MTHGLGVSRGAGRDGAQQFVNAPIQAFVPILVHHIDRNRMVGTHPAT